MENSILQAARSEQRDLEQSIAVIDAEYAAYLERKKSLAQRLEAIKALRVAYGDPPATTAAKENSEIAQLADSFSKALTARGDSHKARVLNAAIERLKNESPKRTKQLLEEIEKRGVEFNARDKAGNLSVILSKDDRFVSDRRYGWSLKNENPQDAPTSAGSDAANAASK